MKRGLDRIRRFELDEAAFGDPLDAIAMAPGEPAFYWRSDTRDIEIAALGAVAVVDAGGAARFADAEEQLCTLAARIDDESAAADAWPLAVGGFAFDQEPGSALWAGFPALRFFLPRALWLRRGGSRRLLIAVPEGREQTPLSLLAPARASSPANECRGWRERVDAAVHDIREGRLEKIVLARRHGVDTGIAPEPLLRALAEARPSCFSFLVRWGGRSFVGSSPERLVKVEGRSVEADALAGTAPRGLSRNEDLHCARELLASAKDRREHAIVVEAIRASLTPLLGELSAADEPVLLTLPEAHHLHTPVRGVAAAKARLLEIAGALHPTPAVCGSPRDAAWRRLAAEEPDRGWYGGAVGWLSSNGDGELAVALRAALLDGRRAEVWAGAGIVAGSSAEHEFDETERKMRSILPFLDGSRSTPPDERGARALRAEAAAPDEAARASDDFAA